MTLTSSFFAEEQSLYAQQERIRRERILKTLLPITTLGAIGGVGYDILAIWLQKVGSQPNVWFNFVALLVITAILVGGTVALTRDAIELAVILTIGGGSFGTLFFVVARGLDRGLDPTEFAEFMLFAVVTFLAGSLGNLWTIIVTTLVINATTCIILLMGHPNPAMATIWHEQQGTVFTTAILLEWLIAVFIAAQWYTYRQGMRDLGFAVERARQLEDLKDQFITHVNHELRTPIMTLNGSIEYLLEAAATLPPEVQRRTLERANRNGKMLTQLLSSILDVRRIETEAVTAPQVVNLREIVATASALVMPEGQLSEARELHLQIAPDLTVLAEPTRLQQILTNLLSNAIKYSPAGSPIELTAFRRAHSRSLNGRNANARVGQAMVEIRVRDHGLGIPPDQIPLLFNRFVRLPRDLASNVSGNGLGLYLCRIFAEAMGGSIRVKSSGNPGEGSTFILQLPTAMPEPSTLN